MVGSFDNNVHALKKWYKLFASQNALNSPEICEHWQNVERLGLPDNKDEYWKYTPLDELLAQNFILTKNYNLSNAERDLLSLNLDAYRLVFVNGRFISTLSDKNTGMWNIEVDKGISRRSLPTPIQSEVFLHLTESLSQETTHIYLPKGKVEKYPLYLLHVSYGSEDQQTLNTLIYRHHINIGIDSKGQIIEHFVSMNSNKHFSCARISMLVNNKAQLDHTKLIFENSSSYHFSHNDIMINDNAVVSSNTFIFGTKLTKHQTSTQLNGEMSNVAINSLLLPYKQNVSDTRTYLEHNKGNCISRQLHKIIVREHSTGIFNGLIKVAKYALKTDGQMTNNNLLLSNSAKVNTKPQLEIYADDIKCSHGVTIGQIDQDQVFYLCSRGINYEDARKIVIYAFISEIIESINNNKLRDILLAHIANSL